MSATKTCWLSLCVVGALVMIAAGGVRALPWLAGPFVAVVVWSASSTVDRLRMERRVKLEAAEGIEEIEIWLRTAPDVSNASSGAAVECCPICGVPVDPCDAECRRHGATR